MLLAFTTLAHMTYDGRSEVLPLMKGMATRLLRELLGHARRGITARHYIRRPDAALISAADRVCSRIAMALCGKWDETGKVVELRTA